MKALILDNEVVDVAAKEFEVAPTLTWVDCDNTVHVGFEYKDGKFSDPFALTDEQKAAKAAVQYQFDRKNAYATIAEQLDMQYWDAVNGTTTWKDHVAKVKADNPKP